MSKNIGLKHLRIIIGEADYAHFQNWVRRQYFSLTDIVAPEVRGAWQFSRKQALEIALVASLARYFSDWKLVRRYGRLIFNKLESDRMHTDGLFLNPANGAISLVHRGQTEVRLSEVAESLRQPQSGWVGVDLPDSLPPTDLLYLDFAAMRERVDAAFSAAASDASAVQ